MTKVIGHSLPLWLVGIGIAAYTPEHFRSVALAFMLGGCTHSIVDVFTHGTGPKEKRPFWDTDLKFMWPFRLDLRPLGLWEYRYDHGVLTPKPFELLVLIACAAYIALKWLM